MPEYQIKCSSTAGGIPVSKETFHNPLSASHSTSRASGYISQNSFLTSLDGYPSSYFSHESSDKAYAAITA